MKKFLPHLLITLLFLSAGAVLVHAQDGVCPDGSIPPGGVMDLCPTSGSGPTNTGGSGPTNTGGSGPTNTGGSGPTNTGGSGTSIATTIPNPFNCGGTGGTCTLSTFLTTILHNIILPLGGILVVLAFIWVGFLFVTSGGNTSKFETARRYLLYAAIGAALLLGAELIQAVIQNTLSQL
jgi:hypothetical protein